MGAGWQAFGSNRRGVLLKGLAALCCSALVAGCDTTQTTSAQDQAPATTFEGAYFSPTNGRVGYHMVSNNYFTRTPCAENSPISADAVSVSGAMPPGLLPPKIGMSNASSRFDFEGTPRQAGDWFVTVTWQGLKCSSTSPSYGDATAVVHFHIDP